MSRTALLTAAVEDTEIFRSKLEEQEIKLLHYPLERYLEVEDDNTISDAFEKLNDFENIVHGSKRNARFFVKKVRRYNRLDEVQNRLNLALNQHTADYLEEEGIPAVHPHSNGKAIDLMEFMLRLRRIGNTLYPSGDKTKEDLPGFLKELDVPVQDLVLFTLEGPQEDDLVSYQKEVHAHEPDIIIFHSRRSVNRTLAAFPKLDYTGAGVISGDQAVSNKLETEGIEVDKQAEGSWESILSEMKKL